MTPWTAAQQASLSITNSHSLLSSCTFSPWGHQTICRPLLLLPSIFPSIKSFLMSQSFASCDWSIGVSASASVLPMNIQDWFPLGWIDLISLQSKGLSSLLQYHSWKHQFFDSQLYGPTLTSIHDYSKNQSFDYMYLCWQSNISVFLIRCLGLS